LVAFVGALTSVPQTVRVVVRRDVAGLSMTSYLAWALSWAGWAYYSGSVDAWPKMVSELLGLAMESILLVTIVVVTGRAGVRAFAKAAVVAVPAMVLVLAVGHVWGLVALAVALTTYDVVFIAPQIAAVVRSTSLSGISLVSYTLRFTVSVGWVAYGFSIGRPEAGGWGYVIAPFAAYVIWRVLAERRGVPALTLPEMPVPTVAAEPVAPA
jgi:uncharacterized protein with PQ loop repeat